MVKDVSGLGRKLGNVAEIIFDESDFRRSSPIKLSSYLDIPGCDIIEINCSISSFGLPILDFLSISINTSFNSDGCGWFKLIMIRPMTFESFDRNDGFTTGTSCLRALYGRDIKLGCGLLTSLITEAMYAEVLVGLDWSVADWILASEHGVHLSYGFRDALGRCFVTALTNITGRILTEGSLRVGGPSSNTNSRISSSLI